MKAKPSYYPVMTLRETLRQEACSLTQRLHRSVGRLTSCDLLPCLEYGEEVEFQRQLTQRLEAAGVRVRALSDYYHDRKEDSHCLVVNYSGVKEETLQACMDTLGDIM